MASHGAAAPAIKEKHEDISKPKPSKDSKSFTMNLFRGGLETSQVFPYPKVLNEEQSEMLTMLVDPMSKFFDVSIFRTQGRKGLTHIKLQ